MRFGSCSAVEVDSLSVGTGMWCSFQLDPIAGFTFDIF